MQTPEPNAEPRVDRAAQPDQAPPPESAENLPSRESAETELVLEELLVSEISIDGMCGVY